MGEQSRASPLFMVRRPGILLPCARPPIIVGVSLGCGLQGRLFPPWLSDIRHLPPDIAAPAAGRALNAGHLNPCWVGAFVRLSFWNRTLI